MLAFSAIKNNDKVGLIVFTNDIELYVRRERQQACAAGHSRSAVFRARGRGTDIPKALGYLNSVIHRKAVVFLVSDFMEEGYERDLRVAGRRHDLIAVTVTDPRELTVPDVGRIAVRDAETGHETLVNTSDRRLREYYEDDAAKRVRQRDETLRRNRVDVMHTSTDKLYVEEIYRFFKKRERRLSGRAAL